METASNLSEESFCLSTKIVAIVAGAVGFYLMTTYFSGGKCRSKARLDGKTVIVTGSNCGIGYETARDLSRRGARVIMACRNLETAQKAAQEIMEETQNPVQVYKLDLASLKSVREFAAEVSQQEEKIHILINNAGVALCPEMKTEDGFEMHFGTNHLGHFLLTNLLLKKLIASQPSRVINVSSIAHENCEIEFDDLDWKKRLYSRGKAYSESKLANILFTRELAKRMSKSNATKHVTTYSLHPGVVRTEIFRHIVSFGPLKFLVESLLWPFTKSCKDGAQTTIYCAVDEKLANETGKYYKDCKEKKVAPQAEDDQTSEKLWKVSEKLVGL